jgi:hypothetical protein
MHDLVPIGSREYRIETSFLVELSRNAAVHAALWVCLHSQRLHSRVRGGHWPARAIPHRASCQHPLLQSYSPRLMATCSLAGWHHLFDDVLIEVALEDVPCWMTTCQAIPELGAHRFSRSLAESGPVHPDPGPLPKGPEHLVRRPLLC